MKRYLLWLFDPLYRFKRWRLPGYTWLAIFFARLAFWYWIEERWGKA